MNYLNKEIKALRIKSGLTQTQLAERAGLTQVSVSRIERGLNAQIGTLIAIFNALGARLLVTFDNQEGGANEQKNS